MFGYNALACSLNKYDCIFNEGCVKATNNNVIRCSEVGTDNEIKCS
jgi:hypothetical protein